MKSKKAQASTKRMWKQKGQGKKVLAKSKFRGKSLVKVSTTVSPSKTTRDRSARTRSKDGPTPKKQRIKSKTSPDSLTPQTKTTNDAHTRKLQQNIMYVDSQPRKHVRNNEIGSQAKMSEDEMGQVVDDNLAADVSELMAEMEQQLCVGTNELP